MTAASLLTGATTTMTTAVSSIWTMVTSNPILSTVAGVGVLGLGFRVFRKAKKAARF